MAFSRLGKVSVWVEGNVVLYELESTLLAFVIELVRQGTLDRDIHIVPLAHLEDQLQRPGSSR